MRSLTRCQVSGPPEDYPGEWEPLPGLDPEEPPALVVVIDTSSVIGIKYKVPTDDQWDVFDTMRHLVEEGRLVFPTQVHRELSREKHADAPGAWCGGAAKVVQHSDAPDEVLSEIGWAIAGLVEEDAEADNEPADPYVLAMAYHLRQTGGYDVVVVTEDCVDRLPRKIALTTACEKIDMPCWTTEDFIKWVLSVPLGEK